MARRRKPPEGFGRLAAALASSDEAAPRIEQRLVRLTITTRWVTICAGIIFGLLRTAARPLRRRARSPWSRSPRVQSFHQLDPTPSPGIRFLVIFELILTVTASTITGGLGSPFVLTPVTGLLLAGYVWGRRAHCRHRDRGRDRGGGHHRDAVGRRDRSARGRPDRRRVPPLRRARRVHAQPDHRHREPSRRRHRPGRGDGDRQRAARLAARARADAAVVVRPARGRRLDARPAPFGRALQRARGARARRSAVGVDRRARRRRAAARRT